MTHRWLQCPTPRPNPRVVLICFPHAGGMASSFYPWVRALPASMEVHCVQYPPLEYRRNWSSSDQDNRLRSWARSIAHELSVFQGHRISLFGHSFGAILAFETCVQLKEKAVPVERIFLSGAAPVGMSAGPFSSDAGDDELMQAVSSLGFLRPGWSRHHKELSAIISALRSDLKVLEEYARGLRPTSVDSPITVMGGRADETVSIAALQTWRNLTTEACEVLEFPGGHFFPQTHEQKVTSCICERLHIPDDVRTWGGP